MTQREAAALGMRVALGALVSWVAGYLILVVVDRMSGGHQLGEKVLLEVLQRHMDFSSVRRHWTAPWAMLQVHFRL
jgi:hypothetical protein